MLMERTPYHLSGGGTLFGPELWRLRCSTGNNTVISTTYISWLFTMLWMCIGWVFIGFYRDTIFVGLFFPANTLKLNQKSELRQRRYFQHTIQVPFMKGVVKRGALQWILIIMFSLFITPLGYSVISHICANLSSTKGREVWIRIRVIHLVHASLLFLRHYLWTETDLSVFLFLWNLGTDNNFVAATRRYLEMEWRL